MTMRPLAMIAAIVLSAGSASAAETKVPKSRAMHVKPSKPPLLPLVPVPRDPKPDAFTQSSAPVDRSLHLGGVTITPGGYLAIESGGGGLRRD